MAGEYRQVLPQALRSKGLDDIAKTIENKDVMIALTGNFIGDVKTLDNLTEVFIEALDEYDGELQDISNKYLQGLKNKKMVPVFSFNGKTFTKGQGHWSPGELYLKS